jgi:two-component system LytT family sensor kinase
MIKGGRDHPLRPVFMSLIPIGNLYIAVDLIGYSTGLAITILLFILTLRTSMLPGTSRAYIPGAVCALLWNLGGFASVVSCAVSSPAVTRARLIVWAFQFTGAAAWPLAMLRIWRPPVLLRWQRIGSRILQIVALVNASAIMIAMWLSAILNNHRLTLVVMEFTSFNASVLLVAGAVVLLKGRMTSRVTWFASSIILLGILASSLAIVVEETFQFQGTAGTVFGLVSEHSVLLIVLGAFFLCARFRFADVFIRFTVRILLASILAVLMVLVFESSALRFVAGLTSFPVAVHLVAASAIAATLLVSFAYLDRRIELLANCWIFQAPDHRLAARQFGEALAQLHDESEIPPAAESGIRTPLELEDVRLIQMDKQPEVNWPAELRNGEMLELDCSNFLRNALSMPNLELLVPVRSAGCVTHVLAVSPGPARRGLVSDEVNFLRMAAANLGARFDTTRLERETVERRSREALLLQQVTEAELRALRAQINPHFLFNSLNSIANLIEVNPPAAETMTLRLARVFRYVLAHSSHATTPLHDEIEFLRTYLEIEGARFGDRLNVQFDVDPAAATEHIPSLILQPVVENALKHGLGPKVGPGCLWISARLEGEQLRVEVADDGIGAPWAAPRNNGDQSVPVREGARDSRSGVGLRNIQERLDTYYRHRARFSFERRDKGGTCVTFLLPRSPYESGMRPPADRPASQNGQHGQSELPESNGAAAS